MTQYPALFEVPGLASYVSGTGDNRVMTLPDATGRVLMTSFSQTKALCTGGTTNNQVTLLTGNMPTHKHGVGSRPHQLPCRLHLHLGAVWTAGTVMGGTRVEGTVHGVVVEHHIHYGFDMNTAPSTWESVSTRRSLQARRSVQRPQPPGHGGPVPLHDACHSQRVTVNSHRFRTHATINREADHKHPISGNIPYATTHAVTRTTLVMETPFDITPAFLTIYTYIRV